MKTQTILLLTVITLLFIRCSSELPETDAIFDEKIALSKRIELAMKKNYLADLGVDEEKIQTEDFTGY